MKPQEDVFWSRVGVKGPHECWLWTGATSSGGHGSLVWGQAHTAAHRLALSFAVASPSPDACALHHCDVPACCNPLHLYWGTRAENNADRHRRGRNNSDARRGALNGSHTKPESRRVGSLHGNARVTEDDVRRIRAERMTTAEAMAAFGISHGAAKKIRLGASWKHVEVPS